MKSTVNNWRLQKSKDQVVNKNHCIHHHNAYATSLQSKVSVDYKVYKRVIVTARYGKIAKYMYLKYDVTLASPPHDLEKINK